MLGEREGKRGHYQQVPLYTYCCLHKAFSFFYYFLTFYVYSSPLPSFPACTFLPPCCLTGQGSMQGITCIRVRCLSVSCLFSSTSPLLLSYLAQFPSSLPLGTEIYTKNNMHTCKTSYSSYTASSYAGCCSGQEDRRGIILLTRTVEIN